MGETENHDSEPRKTWVKADLGQGVEDSIHPALEFPPPPPQTPLHGGTFPRRERKSAQHNNEEGLIAKGSRVSVRGRSVSHGRKDNNKSLKQKRKEIWGWPRDETHDSNVVFQRAGRSGRLRARSFPPRLQSHLMLSRI